MLHYSWRQTHPTTAFFLSPKPKINPYNLTGCIFECHNKLVKSVPNKERTDRCVDLTPSHNGSLIGSSIFRYQSLEPGQRYQKMAPNSVPGLRIPSAEGPYQKEIPTNYQPICLRAVAWPIVPIEAPRRTILLGQGLMNALCYRINFPNCPIESCGLTCEK